MPTYVIEATVIVTQTERFTVEAKSARDAKEEVYLGRVEGEFIDPLDWDVDRITSCQEQV